MDDPYKCADLINPGLSEQAEIFDLQMRYIAKKYTCVSLDDIGMFLKKGKFPKGTIAITFDDGFYDNIKYALPIFKKYNIPATIYITTRCLDDRELFWPSRTMYLFSNTTQSKLEDREFLKRTIRLETPEQRNEARLLVNQVCECLPGVERARWLSLLEKELQTNHAKDIPAIMMRSSQVRELLNCGIIVGSHTMTHPNLCKMSDEDAWEELKTSKQELEKLTGIESRHFSYPNPFSQPHCDERVISLVKKAGYETAVTSLWGRCSVSVNALAIPRIGIVHHQKTLKNFVSGIEKARLGVKRG
jgi:peptidoglycan/xylan/chitin deacetylase (PgdA/CDA1 family)